MHFIAAKSSPLDFLWIKRKTDYFYITIEKLELFYKKNMSPPLRTQKITKMHLVMLQEE